MDEPFATASLWDYRRRIADLYSAVRRDPDPEQGWRRWRAGRNELFAGHPQSPLDDEAKAGFEGLRYFDYDPSLRVIGEIRPGEAVTVELARSGEGAVRANRFGDVHFSLNGDSHRLAIYWLECYGGGVFLPFTDATSGTSTYGGGRYLLDTAKGADLGSDRARVLLDFNFAYHPSCVHSERWSCPLAPQANRLGTPINAGERLA